MSLIFRPNGLYESNWDGDLRRNIIRPADPDKTFIYLAEDIELDETVTLRDIMNFVRKNEDLTDFIRMYSFCFHIDEFHECLDKHPVIDENGEIEYLEIYWYTGTHHYKEDEPFHLTQSPDFHGIGKRDGESTAFAVECIPLEEIAHLRLVLNEEFTINHYQAYKEPHFINGEQKYKTSFTLLQVLNAIYWEISFHGGPQENQKFVEEINRRVEDFKSGKDPGIPADEVFRKMKEELKEQEPPLPPLEIEDE